MTYLICQRCHQTYSFRMTSSCSGILSATVFDECDKLSSFPPSESTLPSSKVPIFSGIFKISIAVEERRLQGSQIRSHRRTRPFFYIGIEVLLLSYIVNCTYLALVACLTKAHGVGLECRSIIYREQNCKAASGDIDPLFITNVKSHIPA